jgi:hypothetical protein
MARGRALLGKAVEGSQWARSDLALTAEREWPFEKPESGQSRTRSKCVFPLDFWDSENARDQLNVASDNPTF